MLSALITLVIYLLIAGVIWWGVNTILGVLPIPEPIRTVIYVIMVVILVLIVLYALLGLIGALGVPIKFPVLR